MPQTSPNSAPQKSQNATPNADSDSQSTPSSSAIPSHTVDISSDTSTDTTAPDTSASPHRSTLFKWDTKQVPDGSYQIKVVADDSPSNAVDAQSAETVSEEVLVDNTAPVVTIDAATPLNGVIAVNGTAKGNLAAIKAVQYKIDNSPDWIAAAPSDGIFDTALERYTLTTATLPVGTHKITVEAINQAGLTGTATVEVTIRKVVVLNVDYVPPSMVLNGPQWWVSRL